MILLKTVVVIGGGAAGMMAALAAAEEKTCEVVLIERQARVGRKLMATGNGRCNLTNMHMSLPHYHGKDTGFAEYALDRFSPEDTRAYFRTLGLLTTVQADGRVYPQSDMANSVVDVLRMALETAQVRQMTGNRTVQIRKKGNRFTLLLENATQEADAVIVACGGIAGGKLGGVSDGYDLLESMGHTRTPLYPSLVPVRTDTEYTRSLKGVRAEAALVLRKKGRAFAETRGEVQFTETGLSGPATFELSRMAAYEGGTLEADLLPSVSLEDLYFLLKERQTHMPDLETGQMLVGMIHNRLSMVVAKAAGFSPSQPAKTLNNEDIDRLAASCKKMCFEVHGTSGFDVAQVTAGGICTDEFCTETMESRLVRGLYACGEVLDIDGDCGGYNLQWAWASGRLAGMTAAQEHGSRE